MRALLFVIVLLAIALGISPLITGVMFKKVYMQQVAYYQQQLAKSQVKLEVVDYKSGWFHSNAKLRLTDMEKNNNTLMPQVTSEIDSTIDHGPLVQNPKTGSLSLGYATVHTNVHLPSFLEGFLQNKGKGALQINSLVKFDGKTWLNHYEVPPITLGNNFKWDGLIGDATIYYSDTDPMDVDAAFTIGATSFNPPLSISKLPSASTQPITIMGKAQQQLPLNLWNGDSSLTTNGANVQWKNGNQINIGKLDISAKYGLVANNLYNYDLQATLASLTLPSSLPINSFTNVVKAIKLEGLDANGLSNFQKQYQQMLQDDNMNEADKRQMIDLLLKVLSPSSKLIVILSTDTNLGGAAANLDISFTNGVPQTVEELQTKLNVNLNAHAAINLVDTLVNLAPPSTDNSKPSLRQQIDTWVQQGYVVKDDKNYSIVFSKQGATYTVNNKDISADVQAAMQKAPETAPGPVVPTTTTPQTQVTPASPATPTPEEVPAPTPQETMKPAQEEPEVKPNPNLPPNAGMVTQPVQ